ncbi:MAG: hypothetical protein WCA49_09985 [Candidatus Sulfotelmatobacter sp.]
MPETVNHPYIEFREVSKAFGENAVLDRVSFNVMPSLTTLYPVKRFVATLRR